MIDLRDYQKRIVAGAVEALNRYKIAYLAMEVRTGKTLTALSTAQQAGAKKVLFATTKKAIGSIETDYEKGEFLFDIVVINHESIHKAGSGFDLAIIDEAHRLGTFPKPSNRAKAAKEVCRGIPVIFLSGTPTPESYSQIFHQLYISSYSPFREYRNFYAFARDFVQVKQKRINGYIVNDYTDARIEDIRRYIAPFWFSFTQQEAGFKSKATDYKFFVPMPEESARLISTLRRDKIAMLGGSVIMGDTPAKLLAKIHQIGGGTVKDEGGEAHIIDTTKAEYIKRKFNGHKIAVYYLFKAEGELLRAVFDNWTDKPEVFQREKDITFLGQLVSAREGIRLDSAEAIVFYSMAYSYLSYEQTRNRIQSKERETPTPCYFFFSRGGIDEDIYEAVTAKQDFTTEWYRKKHGDI